MDDNLPRNQWRLGRVTVANVQDDGFVRSVKLTVGDRTLDKRGRRNGLLSEIERPIHKLVLLIGVQCLKNVHDGCRLYLLRRLK